MKYALEDYINKIESKFSNEQVVFMKKEERKMTDILIEQFKNDVSKIILNRQSKCKKADLLNIEIEDEETEIESRVGIINILMENNYVVITENEDYNEATISIYNIDEIMNSIDNMYLYLYKLDNDADKLSNTIEDMVHKIKAVITVRPKV